MNDDRHEALTECGRAYPSGTTCENQASQWAYGDGELPTGYYCRCGAYRGYTGDRPGRQVD